METMNLHNVEFIKSAAAGRDLIVDGLPQVVFSGRSNVGKSSVINRILNRKNIARVASSPGKTVHINYFLIDKKAYFVDLPGYGYAKVSKAQRDRWSGLMEEYFSRADHIALGVMIVDARHKPTADDATMAEWFNMSGGRRVVVANKTEKAKSSELEQNITRIRETLNLGEDTAIIPFSAQKGTNKDLLSAAIEAAVCRVGS
jgi:GTP-binding protein